MYGDRVIFRSFAAYTTIFTFSNDVSRSGDTYTLDTSTGQSIKGTWADERLNAAKRYHYFCTNGLSSCSKTQIGYIHYFGYSDSIYYMPVGGYDDIEAMKAAMHSNTTNSIAKATIETWFEAEGLDAHEDDLEDAIFCNDRSYYSGSLRSKDSDAGTTYSFHGAYGRNAVKNAQNNYEPSLDCTSADDAFTKDDTVNGNGKLNHKTGLITEDELTMAGNGWSGYDTSAYLYTGQNTWSASPYNYDSNSANEFGWGSSSKCSYVDSAYSLPFGLRPLVSLKAGTSFVSGTGLKTDPYIVP
jgi:hypothetical protein